MPLPKAAPGVKVSCGACGAISPVDKCTVRADGTYECPGCGAPVDPNQVVAHRDDVPAVRPPPVYCGKCASEWPIVNGRPWPNCGHPVAAAVDHPSKAERINPPAGLPRPDADPGPSLSPGPQPQGAPVNRISVVWGESRFPVMKGDQYNAMKVGGHIVTRDLRPGESVQAAAAEIVPDLEKIADALFAKQRAWYLKKLGLIMDEDP